MSGPKAKHQRRGFVKSVSFWLGIYVGNFKGGIDFLVKKSVKNTFFNNKIEIHQPKTPNYTSQKSALFIKIYTFNQKK